MCGGDRSVSDCAVPGRKKFCVAPKTRRAWRGMAGAAFSAKRRIVIAETAKDMEKPTMQHTKCDPMPNSFTVQTVRNVKTRFSSQRANT